MTPQEAIEWLEAIEEKYIHGGDNYFDEKRKIAINNAITALKKQIPKKPVIKTHKYIGSDDDFTNKYHCPVCNALMINEDTNGFFAGRKQKYCNCGQALDWSDKE